MIFLANAGPIPGSESNWSAVAVLISSKPDFFAVLAAGAVDFVLDALGFVLIDGVGVEPEE